jgi:hypothetical protein
MCEAVLAHDAVGVMAEVQFFWGAGWPIADIPRPSDKDPLRLAIKACLIERMAEVWSAPPKNEAATAPAWCSEIGPVAAEFSVVSPEYRNSFALESPVFRKRNLFAPRDYLFFV